jgi:hypothetical protein
MSSLLAVLGELVAEHELPPSVFGASPTAS